MTNTSDEGKNIKDKKMKIPSPFFNKQSLYKYEEYINKLLYNNVPFTLFAIAFAASLIYWIVPENFNIGLYFKQTSNDEIWYYSVILVIFYRLIIYIWYKKTQESTNLVKYHYYLFVLGTSLTAFFFGILPILLSQPNLSLEVFYILVIYALVGGGVQSLSISLLSSILYISLGLGFLILYFVVQILTSSNSIINIAMLISTIFYYIFLLKQIFYFNSLIRENLLYNINIENTLSELNSTKNQLENIINTGAQGIWYLNESFKFIYVNKKFCDILGYSSDELIDHSLFDFVDNEGRMKIMQLVIDRYKKKSIEAVEYELKVNNKNGDDVFLIVYSYPEYDPNSDKIRFLGSVYDVTKQKRNLEKIFQTEQKFKKVVDISPVGIIILQNENIVFSNKAFHKILDAVDDSEISGKSIFVFLDERYHKIKRERLSNIEKNREISNIPVDEEFISLKGVRKYVKMTSSYFEYNDQPAFLLMASDITTQRHTMEKVETLETHDALTGLPNRNLLTLKLNEELKKAKHDIESSTIIFYINFDQFKNINEILGFNIGDQLIQTVSQRIKNYIRDIDFMARLEGDEFVALFTKFPKDPQKVISLAKKINEATYEGVIIEGRQVRITCSIGIARFPEDGDNEFTLINNANIAMREAKSQGGNTFKFYSYKFKTELLEETSFKNAIMMAINNNEFNMEYQPKVFLKSGQIDSFEALLRWDSPILGAVNPLKIINYAEKNGLISKITKMIFEQCCQQIVTWKEKSLPLYRIAVNLSPSNFDEANLPDIFSDIMKKYNVNPQLFEIEITEQLFLLESDKHTSILNRFKRMGMKIALDDFGTGYSALSYLQHLRLDFIKIDRSFIKALPRDTDACTLVTTIISMSHNLGFQVVAEGVETIEQLHFLKDNDCDIIQGFYVSIPLKGVEVEEFIKNYKVL